MKSNALIDAQATDTATDTETDRASEPGDRPALRIGDEAYPPYPAHDIRAPERQCVALGAAVGAAGLSGRIRPIDMMLPPFTTDDSLERPWAIERMSTLTPRAVPRPVSPSKRLVGRILPRRRR